MVNFVLKGKSLSEIVSSLSSLVNLPVVMVDSDLVLLDYEVPAGYQNNTPLIERLRHSQGYLELGVCYPPEVLETTVEGKKPCYYCQKSPGEYDFLFPITAGDAFYGLIIVPGLEQELDRDKTVALEAASLAIALNTLKKRNQGSKAENELDFLMSFLAIKSRENTLFRQHSCLDLDGPYCRFWLNCRETPWSGNKTVIARDRIEKMLQRQLRSALDMVHPQNIMAHALGSNVVLLRLPETWNEEERIEQSKMIMHRLKNIIQARMGDIPVSMAMGRIYDHIEWVSSSYIQAWETMEIGKNCCPRFLPSIIPTWAYHLVAAETNSLYQRLQIC